MGEVMKVSDKDAKLFFDLMWMLQYFVNQKHKIHSNIKSLEEYVECSTEEKFKVRTALYSDINIIDSFAIFSFFSHSLRQKNFKFQKRLKYLNFGSCYTVLPAPSQA